jgi:hypothetical protein
MIQLQRPAFYWTRQGWRCPAYAVTIALAIFAGMILAVCLWPVWQKRFDPHEISRRNLATLARALDAYTRDHGGQLPPAALRSQDGTPLLSWRVLLLPYLGEKHLYERFHLDEPWDGPHNSKLLAHMPRVYAPVQGINHRPHETFYQVFDGGMAFPGSAWTVRPRFVESDIIVIVEGGDTVPWTKPADLHFSEGYRPLPALGGLFPEGFHAARRRGDVSFIPRNSLDDDRPLRDSIDGGNRMEGNDW